MLKFVQRLIWLFLYGYLSFGFYAHANHLAVPGYDGNSVHPENDNIISAANDTAGAPQESSWIYMLVDPRKVQGYANWINVGSKILVPGKEVCPGEGLQEWVWRNYREIAERYSIVSDIEQHPGLQKILKDENLSSEERDARYLELVAKKIQAAGDDGVWQHNEYTQSVKAELEYSLASTVALAIFNVIILRLLVNRYDKERQFDQWLTGLFNHFLGVGTAAANAGATTVLAIAKPCITSCDSACGKRCSGFTNLLPKPFESKMAGNLGEHIKFFPWYQISATFARILYQSPCSGWVEFGRDFVVPASLALLLKGTQIYRNDVGVTNSLAIEGLAASVAYASISNFQNPTGASDQLLYLLKGHMNLLIFDFVGTAGMAAMATGKMLIGMAFNECESTINSMVPLIMIVPALYRAPAIGVQPKLLLGGAIMAGDIYAAVLEGHTEYLMVPLAFIFANLEGGSKLKTAGLICALLFAPMNYLYKNYLEQDVSQ